MENRQYMIFSLSEADAIDFNEVLQTSAETLRKSIDGTKSFVKWETKIITNPTPTQLGLDENGQPIEEPTTEEESTVEFYIPESVNTLTTKEGPYTHDEILLILAGPEWTDPNLDSKA
jgi:hypothetical protein